MKYLLRPIATLAVAILFTACKKEWNELGSQLVVSDDLELFSFDDQEIKISVVKEDSLRSLNSSTSYIGYLNDPYFGNTTASLYTEFRIPSTDVDFGALCSGRLHCVISRYSRLLWRHTFSFDYQR